MAYRQYQKATLLPQLLKQSSLSYMQNEQLSALVTTGDGVVIWEFISQQIDLRSGVVQDKLQVKCDRHCGVCIVASGFKVVPLQAPLALQCGH